MRNLWDKILNDARGAEFGVMAAISNDPALDDDVVVGAE
jgi:hypothetical protein